MRNEWLHLQVYYTTLHRASTRRKASGQIFLLLLGVLAVQSVTLVHKVPAIPMEHSVGNLGIGWHWVGYGLIKWQSFFPVLFWFSCAIFLQLCLLCVALPSLVLIYQVLIYPAMICFYIFSINKKFPVLFFFFFNCYWGRLFVFFVSETKGSLLKCNR